MTFEALARQLDKLQSDVAAMREAVSARFDATDRKHAQEIGILQTLVARVGQR